MKARRADGSVLADLDTSLLNFISHHGIHKVSEIISTLGGCTTVETREAFGKMVRDFSSKPLEVNEDEYEDQDLDLEDEDEDVDEGDDEADWKLFGDTKRASLVKRPQTPTEDEQEPKKPRTAEDSCVQGDKTEAAGIQNSSR